MKAGIEDFFITSDTHFGHDRDFIFEPRGFSNIKDHDLKIISNWNEVVSPNDTVYHLGDAIMGPNRDYGCECLRQLNGHIILIIGNHDSDSKMELYKKLPNIEILGYATMLKDDGWNFLLSHYPTLVGNFDDNAQTKNFCLHGHTHSNDKWQYFANRCYNVSLDAHSCMPIKISEIKADIRHKLNWPIKA